MPKTKNSRIALTPTRMDALKSERCRTLIGSLTLLKDAPDAPHGLKPALIDSWLAGGKTARKDHYEYVIQRYKSFPDNHVNKRRPIRDAPDRIEVTTAVRKKLRMLHGRAPLKYLDHAPGKFSDVKLAHVLSGRDKTIPREFMDYLAALVEAPAPSAADVTTPCLPDLRLRDLPDEPPPLTTFALPRKIGYARVSTADQNLSLQISALEKAGCHRIYSDHGISGCQRSRPEFDMALNTLKAGDTLIIWRLDSMSRSLRDLIEINRLLKARGAFFESLTEKIDTSTPMGEFVFHILGAVAQLEREIIRERTLAGLAVAAADGKHPGRPRSLTDEQVHWAYEAMALKGVSFEDVASDLDVCPETVKRRFRELRNAGIAEFMDVPV